MLTPEELEKLSGAETLFPSPIPVQFVSSDEYMPSPQSAKQKEFEARIKEMGLKLAKRHGMSRRKFFKTAGGMAAAFAAMNEPCRHVFGTTGTGSTRPGGHLRSPSVRVREGRSGTTGYYVGHTLADSGW